MSEKRMTLRQQIEAFENGKILAFSGELDDAGCWNFYDWFCNDSALQAKAVRLMKKVIKFVKANPDLDLDTHHVWFKNNCPMVGPLYDDIRITQNFGDEVNYYVIIPKSGHTGKAELYKYPEYNNPIKTGDTFKDLL